ncbi:MAG: hypothetical protein QX193_03275 [Methylococcales bacterium]|nr:hypothetical protein [Methylococcales bacterium]
MPSFGHSQIYYAVISSKANMGESFSHSHYCAYQYTSIHDLRHTDASISINNGASLYEVQHLLGHSQKRRRADMHI